MFSKKPVIITLLLIVSLAAGTVLDMGVGTKVWGQECDVEIIKVTRGEDIGFEFTATFLSDVDEFTLFDGESEFVAFDSRDLLIVTETVPSGWRLADIVCESDGVGIAVFEDGIVATCPGGEFRSAECVFINVNPADIPTLSEWGMIAAAAGLGLVGVFFALKRRLRASW